jgi:hypothetical protein
MKGCFMNNELEIMWKTAQFKALFRKVPGDVEISGAALRKLDNR